MDQTTTMIIALTTLITGFCCFGLKCKHHRMMTRKITNEPVVVILDEDPISSP